MVPERQTAQMQFQRYRSNALIGPQVRQERGYNPHQQAVRQELGLQSLQYNRRGSSSSVANTCNTDSAVFLTQNAA